MALTLVRSAHGAAHSSRRPRREHKRLEFSLPHHTHPTHRATILRRVLHLNPKVLLQMLIHSLQGFLPHKPMLSCCVYECSPGSLLYSGKAVTEVVVNGAVLVLLPTVEQRRKRGSMQRTTGEATHVLPRCGRFLDLGKVAVSVLRWWIYKEHSGSRAASLRWKSIATWIGSSGSSLATLWAIPCPVAKLLALMAPGLRHQVTDAHAMPAVMPFRPGRHEPSARPGILQRLPMVQVRALGAVDAEGPR